MKRTTRQNAEIGIAIKGKRFNLMFAMIHTVWPVYYELLCLPYIFVPYFSYIIIYKSYSMIWVDFEQENRIQFGQNPGRRTKPKKVDGEGARMRSDIELFEAKLAQRNANEEPKPLDGPEYMAKIKSEAAENRKKANERNQRRRKVLVETIKELFLYHLTENWHLPEQLSEQRRNNYVLGTWHNLCGIARVIKVSEELMHRTCYSEDRNKIIIF